MHWTDLDHTDFYGQPTWVIVGLGLGPDAALSHLWHGRSVTAGRSLPPGAAPMPTARAVWMISASMPAQFLRHGRRLFGGYFGGGAGPGDQEAAPSGSACLQDKGCRSAMERMRRASTARARSTRSSGRKGGWAPTISIFSICMPSIPAHRSWKCCARWRTCGQAPLCRRLELCGLATPEVADDRGARGPAALHGPPSLSLAGWP
ncbi:hypothetical protein SAMN07250955_108137 [Arboricoccus pini]|uniref:Uncharacterized protein n=1 Tax=Arboricoccus pini TaxID=1963835 RepID=A0A212RH05_9PROT|nr:hypothetical protein SAMN07250955_108137 [Arboricoccus pini]